MGFLGHHDGASLDSLFLASVKVFNLATGLAGTMILAHSLSLQAYGTYSQGNLVVALCSSVTILGFADAANYFFNRKREKASSGAYINTMFTVQLIVGMLAAAVMLSLQGAIIGYFHNPLLQPLFVWLVFRPMMVNVASMLQVLVVSIGKAKTVALRNALFSLAKLAAILVTALITSNVVILFAVLFALEALTALWFWSVFRKNRFSITLVRIDLGLLREILIFCLPMALYVMTSTLSRQMGVLVIGAHESTEAYAIYANCATVLPLDAVSNSFLTVLIPILTRYIGRSDFVRARSLFKRYLSVGYLTTVTLSIACLIVAPELLEVLFGSQYLPGTTVFSLYLVSAMIRFANLSIVLSASGKTKLLMLVSFATLGVNGIACVVGFYLIGFEGPALASVATSAGMTIALLALSVQQIGCSLSGAFAGKHVLFYAATVVVGAFAAIAIKAAIEPLSLPPAATVCAVAVPFVAGVLLLNSRHLRESLSSINKMK